MTELDQPAGGTESVPPVNVAVVGLGYWGPNLVRAFHEQPGQRSWRSAMRSL